jgi:hypothetical protein
VISEHYFPFAPGDRVIVETTLHKAECIEGSVMGVDAAGLTIQEGFTHAHWLPWVSILRVEIVAEERRIDEIAQALDRRAAKAATGTDPQLA